MKCVSVIFVATMALIATYFFITSSPKTEVVQDNDVGTQAFVSTLVAARDVRLLKTPNVRVLPPGFDKQIARKELSNILKIDLTLERNAELEALYQKWIQFDSDDALFYINTFSDESIRSMLYVVALGVWSKDNEITFDAWLRDNDPDERYVDALVAIVVDKTTPEVLAIEWADYIADLESSEHSRQKVLDRWVIKDPNGIVRWGITTAKGRSLLTEIFQTMSRKNAEGVFLSLALLENEKQSLVVHVLSAIRGHLKPEQVTQNLMIAIQILPEQIRSLTIRMMMPHFSQWDNPGEIGDMINALPNDYYRAVMMESLAYTWAIQDPESAAQFVLTLPKSDMQSQAVAGVISQWHMKDLPAASNWLNDVRGDDVETDRAAHHLASHAAEKPEYVDIAADWVGRIKDPQLKKITTQDVVANWFSHNEERAADFLKEQNIFTKEKLQWFLKDQKVNKDLILEQERLFNERQK